MEQSSCSAENHCFHLEIPAVPEQVGHARHAMAAFLQGHAWSESDADELLLAMGEACNNAVNYGGRGVVEPRLIVSCQRLDGLRLQVDVRNQGNGFYPDIKEYGQMPDDEYATHGRGFGLMLALVDHVQVLSDGENTIIRLTKSKTS